MLRRSGGRGRHGGGPDPSLLAGRPGERPGRGLPQVATAAAPALVPVPPLLPAGVRSRDSSPSLRRRSSTSSVRADSALPRREDGLHHCCSASGERAAWLVFMFVLMLSRAWDHACERLPHAQAKDVLALSDFVKSHQQDYIKPGKLGEPSRTCTRRSFSKVGSSGST